MKSKIGLTQEGILKLNNMHFFPLLMVLTIVLFSASCDKKTKKPVVENVNPVVEEKKEESSFYKVTFIELGSVKCIPCKMMQPIMKEIEEEYAGKVKVIFYDVWTEEGRPYAEKYKIRVIPTQIFLDENGNEFFRHEGFFPKDELVKVFVK